MRSVFVVVVGAALLAVGGYVLLEGGRFTTQRQVFDVGGVKVSAEQQSPIAPWAAGIALIAGTAFVLAGLSRKV